ncbi:MULTISPECIES: hypothetical protein [unclassified Microcoleus]|uniref:hypothetical protein n=1 Tax=unclassified Microcoleus TaxID=2642155 RepID=UPI0025DDDDBA|nr:MULTISPECIES: hypothetical protein [unclassified Microcoleus]
MGDYVRLIVLANIMQALNARHVSRFKKKPSPFPFVQVKPAAIALQLCLFYQFSVGQALDRASELSPKSGRVCEITIALTGRKQILRLNQPY